MKTDALAAIVIVVGMGVVAGAEVGFISPFAALVLGAGLVTAVMFSFAKGIPKTEAVMAQGNGEDTLKGRGFGLEAEIRGPNLIARSIGSPLWTNVLLLAIAAGLYLHDSSTSEVQKRQTAAIEVANYLSTQTEERRLEIGKKLAEPEALRRLYR